MNQRLDLPSLATLTTILLFTPTLLGATGTEVERIERGNLVIEGIPDIPAEIEAELMRYENTRGAGFAGWLPQGQGLLISTRFGETNQIHRVSVPGGARQQLTFFDEPVGGAAINPTSEANGFLFTRDVGGSEFYQVFFQSLDNGSYKMLTDGESRNGGILWSSAGDSFVYFTTRRNGFDWDLHVYNIKTGEERPVLASGGVWFPIAWSPDDRSLIATRYVSANESYPHLIDVATGEATPLSPTDEKIAFGGLDFSADGKGIYFVSDEGTDFQHLRYRDLASGETKTLTGHIPWNVTGFDLSEDGQRLAFVTNEDGIGKLRLVDTQTFSQLETPALPIGQVWSLEFSPDDQHLGFVLNSPRSPSDVYSISFEDNTLVRWTHAEIGGLSSDRFIEPTLVRYETFDEREIPAFYYVPEGEGPFPVLIQIHGGPEGQSRPTFNAPIQYYLQEMGIAVLVPNVRGSAGYGKEYLLLDNGMKREDSVKDIGALLDWIEEQPELDSDRVAVTGGSYGGYMVLASMTHYNDRLRAGVDVVGISNFVTFLENTQDYRRDLRRAEYGDERDPTMRRFLERISPTNHAAKITKPLFVAQGLNDPRVPASESEQMVQVIRDNGGLVWYLLANDEGHGFSKKANRDYYRRAVALFLEEHLLPIEDQ